MEAKTTEPTDKPSNPIPTPGVPLPDKTCQPSEVANLENVVQESIRASSELEKEPLSTIPIPPKNLETTYRDEASDSEVKREASTSLSPTSDGSKQRNDPLTDESPTTGSKDAPDEKDDGVTTRSRDASEEASGTLSRKSSTHATDTRTKKKKTMGKRITETLAAIGFKKKNNKKEQKTEEEETKSVKTKSVKSKKGLKSEDNESEVTCDMSQETTSMGQYWQSEDPAVKTVIDLEEHMKSEKNVPCLQENIVDATTKGISKLPSDKKSKTENSLEKAEYSVLGTQKETVRPLETTTVAAVTTSTAFKHHEKESVTPGTLGEVTLDPPTRQLAETIDLNSDSVKEILSNVIDVTMTKSTEIKKSLKDGESCDISSKDREESSEIEMTENIFSKHISEKVTGSIFHGVNLLEIFHADGAQNYCNTNTSETLPQKSTESVDEPGKKVEEKSSSNMEYMQDDHCFDSQRPSSTTFLYDQPQSNKSNEELSSSPSEVEKLGKIIDNKEEDKTPDANKNQ